MKRHEQFCRPDLHPISGPLSARSPLDLHPISGLLSARSPPDLLPRSAPPLRHAATALFARSAQSRRISCRSSSHLPSELVGDPSDSWPDFPQAPILNPTRTPGTSTRDCEPPASIVFFACARHGSNDNPLAARLHQYNGVALVADSTSRHHMLAGISGAACLEPPVMISALIYKQGVFCVIGELLL